MDRVSCQCLVPKEGEGTVSSHGSKLQLEVVQLQQLRFQAPGVKQRLRFLVQPCWAGATVHPACSKARHHLGLICSPKMALHCAGTMA